MSNFDRSSHSAVILSSFTEKYITPSLMHRAGAVPQRLLAKRKNQAVAGFKGAAKQSAADL
jgi:hypothetical protein